MRDEATQATAQATPTYDGRTIALHWSVAVLAALAWLTAQCLDSMARDAARDVLRSLHCAIGLAFCAALAARMVWRLRGGVRLPPPAPGTRGQVAVSVHRLLYLLLAAAAGLGLALLWVRGDPVFGIAWTSGFDPSHRALRRELSGLHELAANGLMLAAALHAAAALANGYLGHNSVMDRMRPAFRRPRKPAG